MKLHFKAFVIVLVMASCQLLTYAQNTGIQVNMNLTPPYTLSLHDYTQSGSNKLMVTILLKDLNYPIYQARLRFTIEGNGFTLTTKANYMPLPINLQGGIPSILGASDLEGYFLPENLDFNGISKSDYLRTKKLPEGFYRFFVEVLDYKRGSVVSNQGISMAYIVMNEPPIINLPVNASKLAANDPQNILFNWAPRHLGSPNSAFTTEYEFRLYEILPKGRNPYEAVRTMSPIYEAIPALSTTSLMYTMAMPQLIPGNEYAFTVRAVDKEGRDLFKNNGYSDVVMFTWGDECKPPLGIQAEAVTGGGIDISWKTTPQQTGFNIQYRTKGSTSWYTQNSLIDNTSIYELPGSTDIQYQLQSVCGGYQSDFSVIQTIKTKEEVKRNFSCGDGKKDSTISNKKPKASLAIGNQFTAGGYTAKITKISGQDGIFTGECNVLIPFFNLAKVPHKFENIKINELNQMYEGKLVSIYNPDSPFVARIKGNAKDSVQDVASGSSTPSTPGDTTVSLAGEIKGIHINPTGQIVIVSAGGDSTIVTPGSGEVVTITDSKGNEYKATDGVIEKTGGTQVATNNDPNSSNSTSNSQSNTAIGKDHKAGDQLQFGPLTIKLITDPQTVASSTPNVCTYKVDNISVDISFEDQNVGKYKASLTNAYIDYSIDCTTGALLSASIDYDNSNGFPISGIGAMDASIKKANLDIDADGNVSGSLTFEALLTEDKSINNFVYVKKGVNGSFTFQFSNESNLQGSFNMQGIQNLNIDLKNDNSVIASLTNGTVDSNGLLTGDFKLTEPVSFTQNKTKLELKKFDANVTISLLKDQIDFNTIDGEGSIKDLPGTKADLKIKIKADEKKIVATATSKDNDLFKFYGFSLGLEKLIINFTNKLEVSKIEGTDITASYTGAIDAASINGNITMAHILIDDYQIKDLKGSGSLDFPPYAKIKIEDGKYNSNNATLSFSASVDVADNSSSNKLTVKDITVDSDGKITLGTIDVNLLATYGPLTIQFKTAPQKGKSQIQKANATVTIKIADAGVNEKVSFDTEVSYKKTDDSFTYLKTDISGLTYKFPDIYGIQSKITGIGFIYDKSTESTSFEGKVAFNASLPEDKMLNPVLKLRKGLSGNFIFNFGITTEGESSGSFDLTSLTGLNIDLVKEKKAVATLSGSIGKNGVITGRLKTTEEISYENAGFTVTMNSLDMGATYNLNKSEYKITDGSGKATITDITGVTGSLIAELEYKNDNLVASIDKGKSKMEFCGMVVSDMSLDVTMDGDFNFTKIKGDLVAKHPKFKADLNIKSFLIEDGELQSFNIKGNVEYAGFKFTIENANYKDEEFNCSAKVLLAKDFLAVDKFILHKDGEITIGKCAGSITNDLMAIKFSSSLTDTRFTGTFDAKLAKTIAIKGNVDMGSQECSTCPNGAYSFGYYEIVVGAKIPIFPGVSLTELGGQFGYNYSIDFASKSLKGSPLDGKYVAGLSFGLEDNAGMAEFAIDPAVFQWGLGSATLDLRGTLKIPKTKPIINATAIVKLKIPSYDISGNIVADVKIPATTGKIFKANANCSFNFTKTSRVIDVPNLSANVLNVIKFTGNFNNTQNFNSSGVLTSASGALNGNLSYSLNTSFSESYLGASLSGKFKFDFTAGLNTTYNEDGLISALIYGRVKSNGTVNVSVWGSSVSPYYSLDASAKLEKGIPNWKLSSSYNIEVGIQSIGSHSFDGKVTYDFE